MQYIVQFGQTAWDIFLQMAPFLLLGFFFAGLLNVIVTRERVAKYMGKRGFGSAVKAALIGVPLPLCSCGVIPTGISFHKNGAGKGATNSFLISTPQTGFDSILMTYSMMNIYWAVFRPIVAFITGVMGGYATDKLIPETTVEDHASAPNEDAEPEGPVLKRIFTYAFIDFLGDISRQLLLGILIAVLITLFVPQTLFTEYLDNPALNMLIILVASIPLYVCATGSVPIGAALLAAGVSPGAVLVFLMAGPATNAATLTVLWKSIGRKATLVYLGSIVFGALLFGLIMDYGIDSQFLTENLTVGTHVHNGAGAWLATICAILLIGLLIYVEIKKLIPTQYTITQMNTVYNVEGMTCNHCKASVEKNLTKLDGIATVTADPNHNKVIIEGEVSDDQIKAVIDDLGFVYKGKEH